MFPKSSKAIWNKIKDYSTNPKSLLIIGLVLACAGIALVSVGASLSSTVPQGFSSGSQTTDSSLVARDDEGVPIEGIRPSDKAEVDCNVDLQDRDAYRDYAYHAELEMYGNHIANLSISEAKEILGGLRHVFVSVSFWILHKSEIQNFEIASKMIYEQMIAVNAAYRGAKLIFQVHGIRYIRVPDKDYDGCSTSAMVVDLIRGINSTDSIAVIVCNPPDVNGVSRISGDGVHDRSAMVNFSLQKGARYNLGVIYIRLSALKYSMTSLVHQFGHVFGLPHPFPPYQTCKFDGDFIPDTLNVYASSDSCLLENAPLCSPEEVNSALLWGAPGEVFMDISPDDCRNKFTPGQILRMRAIVHAMMGSGYDYLVSEEASQNAHELFSRPVAEPFYRALISKMPGDTILREQMKDSIDDSDVSRDLEVLQNKLAPYADAFKYAEIVANEQVMDMTTSICFDNTEGTASWVGFMKKEVLIDGVEITQAFHPEKNFLNDHIAEIRVFSKYLQNSSLCTSFVPIEGLKQRIMCDQALIGSSIMLTFHVSKISPLCISGISILSLFSPAIEFDQSVGEVPNLWIDRVQSLASQSTTAPGLDAAAALFPLDKRSSDASCTSTRLERQPWWQLELERDFIMESITFTAPNDCTGSISLEKNGINFGKIATDVAHCFARNSTFFINVYIMKNSYLEEETLKSENLCAKSVSISPGTFSKISCGEWHEGDTLLIQASDNRLLKSLQLCDVLIQGSKLVPIGDLVSLASLSVSPKSLTAQLADPVDNDKRTCIISNAGELNESMWQVDFKRPTFLSYLILDAKGPVEVELQGLQRETLWESLNKTGILPVPNILVSSIIIRKFRELCEIRVNEAPRSEALSDSSFLRMGQSGATEYWATYPNQVDTLMRNFSTCEHAISQEKKSIFLSEKMPLKLSSIALSSSSLVPRITVSVQTDAETIICGEEKALFPWKYTKFICHKTGLLVNGIEIKVEDILPHKETISLCPVLVS